MARVVRWRQTWPGKTSSARKCETALRKYALGFPETWEDFPWGERVVKVGKKVFVFMGHPDGRLTLSVKLPESHTVALMLRFAEAHGLRARQERLGDRTFCSQRKPARRLAPRVDRRKLLRGCAQESRGDIFKRNATPKESREI